MLGQWEHNYPDQWTKHNNQDSGYGGEAIHNMTRWDWGQDLFEWFEYYLKGLDHNQIYMRKFSAMMGSGGLNKHELHKT